MPHKCALFGSCTPLTLQHAILAILSPSILIRQAELFLHFLRLGDFGLASEGRVYENSKTSKPFNFEVENTTKVGTPFYLAPELCYEETRQNYSVKSDIWALGVIVYELCALRKPFMA